MGNEKLQQFFNHHMFVVEQEEYVSEGIEWAMVDFGMDLQDCIIMFEKPMGIWAILEEETLFPKATDKSFEDKLKAQHLGKSAPFAKPDKDAPDKCAHFSIIHYAGRVSYNVTAWLEKNKDPVNDTVVDLLKTSSNQLLVFLWREHPGQPEEEAKDEIDPKTGKKKKKKAVSKTVSGVFLADLVSLMTTLHSTEPHFIRCLVPNNHKQPGMVEPPLIMHQLTCNGVLEGIRICMRGFPNRILYPDMKQRYAILGAGKLDAKTEIKKASKIILQSTEGFEAEKYRLGKTKVFFRAGALALLEEKRDDIVTLLIRKLQGQLRGHMRRKDYAKRKQQREFIEVVQRNFRKYIQSRDWPWFIIIQKTRPLIGCVNVEEELRLLEEKATLAWGHYQEQMNTKAKLQEENNELSADLNRLREKMRSEQGDLGAYQEKQAKASAQKADLEVQLEENKNKLERLERERVSAGDGKKAIERELNNIKQDQADAQAKLQKSKQEKEKLDTVLRGLNEEVIHQDESITKMNKEKKHLSDTMAKATEEMNTNQEKLDYLKGIKAKLEKTLDQMDSAVEKEKRDKASAEKDKRKLE